VSIDDVAAAAGVAHGLAFYYFDGKRGLYHAALETVRDDLVRLVRPDPADGDAAAQIKGMARRHFEYFRTHPQLALGLLASATRDPESRAIVDATQWSGAQELLQLLGLPQDPPPALRTAVRGCMRFLEQSSLDWLSNGFDVPVEDLVELNFTVTAAAINEVYGRAVVRRTRARS
jgi:AcrR family transcriptional regulator